MIYKGLRFTVKADINGYTYTVDQITGEQVVITWHDGARGYDRDAVESFLEDGDWVPVHQTSDFLKAIKKCLQ